MHRRSFLKAMGLSGCLFASNWKTLIRGPKSGDTLKRRVGKGWWKAETTRFSVAGATIKSGDVVCLGSDGRVYPANHGKDPMILWGIAMSDSSPDTNIEIMSSGIQGHGR